MQGLRIACSDPLQEKMPMTLGDDVPEFVEERVCTNVRCETKRAHPDDGDTRSLG